MCLTEMIVTPNCLPGPAGVWCRLGVRKARCQTALTGFPNDREGVQRSIINVGVTRRAAVLLLRPIPPGGAMP